MKQHFVASLIFLLSYGFAGSIFSDQADSLNSGFCLHLLASGERDNAALEYERLKDAGFSDSGTVACALGRAYLIRKYGSKAERYFEEGYEASFPGSKQRATAVAGLIRAYLIQKKNSVADFELNDSAVGARAALAMSEYHLLKAAALAADYKLDSARHYWQMIIDDPLYNGRAKKLDELLIWYRQGHLKDPITTYIYSSAIPGWGHLYIGEKKQAVSSFTLMAALSGLCVYEGYALVKGTNRERFVLGMDLFLVGSLIWRRYYASIRKAAYEKSIFINRSIQLQYQRKLVEILLQE